MANQILPGEQICGNYREVNSFMKNIVIKVSALYIRMPELTLNYIRTGTYAERDRTQKINIKMLMLTDKFNSFCIDKQSI